jgi:hypothetical protein
LNLRGSGSNRRRTHPAQHFDGGDTVAKLTKDQRFMLDYAEGRLIRDEENQIRFRLLLAALNAKKAAR